MGALVPDVLTAVRRDYFSAPGLFYSVAVARVLSAAIVLVVAGSSRASKTLYTLGALMGLQALTAVSIGPAAARQILEWEAGQPGWLLRLGAGLSAAGGVVIFAALSARRVSHRPGDELRPQSQQN